MKVKLLKKVRKQVTMYYYKIGYRKFYVLEVKKNKNHPGLIIKDFDIMTITIQYQRQIIELAFSYTPKNKRRRNLNHCGTNPKSYR